MLLGCINNYDLKYNETFNDANASRNQMVLIKGFSSSMSNFYFLEDEGFFSYTQLLYLYDRLQLEYNRLPCVNQLL